MEQVYLAMLSVGARFIENNQAELDFAINRLEKRTGKENLDVAKKYMRFSDL